MSPERKPTTAELQVAAADMARKMRQLAESRTLLKWKEEWKNNRSLNRLMNLLVSFLYLKSRRIADSFVQSNMQGAMDDIAFLDIAANYLVKENAWIPGVYDLWLLERETAEPNPAGSATASMKTELAPPPKTRARTRPVPKLSAASASKASGSHKPSAHLNRASNQGDELKTEGTTAAAKGRVKAEVAEPSLTRAEAAEPRLTRAQHAGKASVGGRKVEETASEDSESVGDEKYHEGEEYEEVEDGDGNEESQVHAKRSRRAAAPAKVAKGAKVAKAAKAAKAMNPAKTTRPPKTTKTKASTAAHKRKAEESPVEPKRKKARGAKTSEIVAAKSDANSGDDGQPVIGVDTMDDKGSVLVHATQPSPPKRRSGGQKKPKVSAEVPGKKTVCVVCHKLHALATAMVQRSDAKSRKAKVEEEDEAIDWMKPMQEKHRKVLQEPPRLGVFLAVDPPGMRTQFPTLHQAATYGPAVSFQCLRLGSL